MKTTRTVSLSRVCLRGRDNPSASRCLCCLKRQPRQTTVGGEEARRLSPDLQRHPGSWAFAGRRVRALLVAREIVAGVAFSRRGSVDGVDAARDIGVDAAPDFEVCRKLNGARSACSRGRPVVGVHEGRGALRDSPIFDAPRDHRPEGEQSSRSHPDDSCLNQPSSHRRPPFPGSEACGAVLPQQGRTGVSSQTGLVPEDSDHILVVMSRRIGAEIKQLDRALEQLGLEELRLAREIVQGVATAAESPATTSGCHESC